jgi:hypothetical protein
VGDAVAPTRIEVAAGTQESIRTVRFVADDDARLMVEWCHDGSTIGPASDPARVARAIHAVITS